MSADVVDQLFLRTADGINPGLEVERALLRHLGNPQEAYPIIHVAGTNGKGSVCAMLSSILTRAGLKTGLYTSPHLNVFNERFKINDQLIDDQPLFDLIRLVETADEELVAAQMILRRATFFELSTAIALTYFKQQHVDVAVIETGMGGTWDATNVIHPVVSVITNISMDHTNYLGDSLVGIAAEKCGIIKDNTPVVYSRMSCELQKIIKIAAEEKHAESYVSDDLVTYEKQAEEAGPECPIQFMVESELLDPVLLTLPGVHQIVNAQLAIAAVHVFRRITGVAVANHAVCQGLSHLTWPGRCQQFSKEPLVFLDGAHNPAGMEVVLSFIRKYNKPIGLVFSVLDDKDVYEMIKVFAADVRYCWVVPIQSSRALSPELIKQHLIQHNVPCEVHSLISGLTASVTWARAHDGVVLITGSLYLVGEVLAYMKHGSINELGTV